MTTHLPFQPLNAPGVRYDTQIFLLVIFITERTSLCFITFCNTYDIQTFGSLILIGIPAVFYPKLAFSKQHALRNGHACFQAMISFDNKWSFCYVFYFCFLKQQYAVFVSCICCLLAVIFVCIIMLNLYKYQICYIGHGEQFFWDCYVLFFKVCCCYLQMNRNNRLSLNDALIII